MANSVSFTSEAAEGAILMSPDQYLAISPAMKDPDAGPQAKALRESLKNGEPIHTAPSLTIKDGKVTEQDGRHRAQAAKDAGIKKIPVKIEGELPEKVTGMRGDEHDLSNVRPVKKWSDITSQATFQALPPEEKEAVRQDFFEKTIAPRVGKDELAAVRADYDEKTRIRIPPTLAAKPSSFVERVGSGMVDPIHGGAQLLTHMLPQSVVDAGNKANNWLADKTGLVAPVPAGGVDQMVNQREQQYQAQRAADGSTGYDWARFIGNTISPASLTVARMIPGAAGANMMMRAGSGAVGGVAMGALNPASGSDFWSDKALQAGLGAVGGAAAPAIAGGAARVISPETSAAAKKLLDEGVKLTPGQILGGTFKRLEDAATGIPFLGDAIKSAQRKGVESFNEAAINRALSPIGERLPKDMKAGREAIEFAADKVSQSYEKLLPTMRGELDGKLISDINGVKALGKNLPDAERGQLERIINNEIIDRFTAAGGKASGETLKEIESELGKNHKIFQRSESYDTRKLGDAVQELQASLRRMFERANPGKAEELTKANTAYANLVRVRDAASLAGAKEGVFSPAQLSGAVRKADPSKAKSSFAKGNALMQDISDAANGVLPSSVPDSGTATRAMIGMSLLGDIGRLTTGLTAALPYSTPGLVMSRLALTSRPQGANALANFVRNNGQALTPALVSGVELAQRP